MVAEVVGLDALLILFVWMVAVAISLWAILDPARRPTPAFEAAGSSKAMWLALIIVFSIFTGIIGPALSIAYLAVIRPKVRAITSGGY